jgi:hypothetical protein
MPSALIEKVESLSGYRPLFPPNDPRASLSPVNHSHLQITLGGSIYHVLSRTCFAGLDYTDRTNKFAHHVILEPNELPPGGPAWLLRQPCFMETRWDGQVRQLPAGRVPPNGDARLSVCAEWQKQTGDAGWAGVIVDSFLKDPERPAFLLFDPGTDLLPLVAEALALLPPDQRWNVNFCTYLSGLPAGMNCAWRGVPRNSEEAMAAQRSPGALVINLVAKMGKAPAGPMVEAARTGRPPARGTPAAVLPPPVPLAAANVSARSSPAPLTPGKAVRGNNAAPGSASPATVAPPPIPGKLPEEGDQKRRAGFGVGMLAGLLVSLIPLVALAMTGVIIVTPLAEHGAKGGPVTVVADTGKNTALQNPATDPDRKADQATIRELRQQVTKLNDEVEKAVQKREEAEKEGQKLRQELVNSKAKVDIPPNAKLEDLAKKQQETEQKLRDAEQNLTVVKGKLTETQQKLKEAEQRVKHAGRPPNVVHAQFDCFNQKGFDLKTVKPSFLPETCALRIVTLAKEYEIPEESKTKNYLKIEEKGGLKFILDCQILVGGREDVPIAEFRIEKNGQVRFEWFQKEKERQELAKFREKARKLLTAILPNHILELRIGQDKYFIGLRDKQTRQAGEPVAPRDLADWQEKLKLEEFLPGKVKYASLVCEGPWKTFLAHGKALPQYKPRTGAGLYMQVSDSTGTEWLVELVHYE